MLPGTGGTEQGSAIGCSGPVCQDKVLATEALGAGSRRAATLWLFVTVHSLSPADGRAAAGPGAGTELGAPGLGKDLSLSPMAVCL